MTTKTYTANCASVKVNEFGIIEITYKDDLQITLADVQELEEIFLDISQGKMLYTMMIANGKMYKFTPDAQEFLSKKSEVNELIQASAIVLDSLQIRILAKFFIRFYKPKYLTKIFANRSKAIDWLLEEKGTHSSHASAESGVEV